MENRETRFWSGGVKWGEKDQLKEFSSNNYWQIGWSKDDESKGAVQAWENISEVQIGDFLSFHGYGGQNDLRIYQISKVIAKDEENGKLFIQKLNNDSDSLFRDKAPKLAKGGWFGTLFEITGKNAINQIFGKYLGENAMSEKLSYYTNLLLENHNLILHGAPGTGKTYTAKNIAELLGAEWEMVQFHPSYDYTDFVEGLRPVRNESNQISFERKDGVFKEFCKKALKNWNDSKKSMDILKKEISLQEKIELFLDKSINEEIFYEITTGNKFQIIDYSDKSIRISIPANEKTREISVSLLELSKLLECESDVRTSTDIKSFFNRKWRTQQDSYTLALFKQIQLFNCVKEYSLMSAFKDLCENTKKRKISINEKNGNKIEIVGVNEDNNSISVSSKSSSKKYEISLSTLNNLEKSFKTTKDLDSIKNVQESFRKVCGVDYCSAYWAVLRKLYEIKETQNQPEPDLKVEEKKFVFIIDEINRGELSKIFGELFYSIDAGYRGENGKIKTQYQNLVENGDDFYDGFFIPENVYIIGTMNDIDRSVECMDFAMRRRFTFAEITAEESAESMGLLPESKIKMANLNEKIEEYGLTSAFQIGASYFKNEEDKSKEKIDYENLWKMHLEPLLHEYLRGQNKIEEKLSVLKSAYDGE